MENEDIVEGALPSEEVDENPELETPETPVEGAEGEEGAGAEEGEDFESKLEKERERLGKKIDKEREKRIETQKKSIPREEVEKLINEKVGAVQKQMLRERAELIAERMAKSQAEKELIMLHYDHSIIASGNLEEDIANAQAIANRKSTQSKISELEGSLKSKKTLLRGGSDGGQPIEQKPKQKFSQDVLEGAKFAGVTPEEFVKKQKS